jgi:hypothetical protein
MSAIKAELLPEILGRDSSMPEKMPHPDRLGKKFYDSFNFFYCFCAGGARRISKMSGLF